LRKRRMDRTISRIR